MPSQLTYKTLNRQLSNSILHLELKQRSHQKRALDARPDEQLINVNRLIRGEQLEHKSLRLSGFDRLEDGLFELAFEARAMSMTVRRAALLSRQLLNYVAPELDQLRASLIR